MKPKKVVFQNITEDVLKRAADIVDRRMPITVYKPKDIAAYKFSVRMYSNQPDEVQFIRDHFGGYYYETNKNGYTLYWIGLQQQRCKEFLQAIRPYVVVKKRNIDLVFKLVAKLIAGRRKKKTPEELAARMQIIEELKKLNNAQYAEVKARLEREKSATGATISPQP